MMFALVFLALVAIIFVIYVARLLIVHHRRKQAMRNDPEAARGRFGEAPTFMDTARDVHSRVRVFGNDEPSTDDQSDAYYPFREQRRRSERPVARRDPDVDPELPSYNDRSTTMPAVPPATYASPITLRREGTTPSSISIDEPPKYEQSDSYAPPPGPPPAPTVRV